MKKLIIFLSIYDEFLNSALKMKQQFNLDVDILYIEDFHKLQYDKNIQDDSLIYFLCNGEKVVDIVKKLKDRHLFIFNKAYWLANYTKFEVQKELKNNSICVPGLFTINDFNVLKFPIFCKENIHAGITFQVYNKNTLQRFFKKFDKENFYFEESVNANGIKSKEFKLYYINGKVFDKNNENNITEEIVKICKVIQTCLNNIEVFSVDIIKTEKQIFIIDVNPASGFYLSDLGRNELEKYINAIIYKNKEGDY